MRALFVSDVHVSAARPGAVSALIALLGAAKGRIDALYVLGDLFDVASSRRCYMVVFAGRGSSRMHIQLLVEVLKLPCGRDVCLRQRRFLVRPPGSFAPQLLRTADGCCGQFFRNCQ